MRDPGEWEPNLWASFGSLPPHVVVAAQCGHCGHKADVDERHLARCGRTELLVHIRNRMRCGHCEKPGKVTLYVRKKPRN